MRISTLRSHVIAVVLGLLALPASALAAGSPYAPVDRPGPPLSVPAPALAASLVCTPNVATSAHEPILLVPGTTLTPSVNFSWNYERALTALRLPYCTVELPGDAMGDVQIAGEYVVHAIRTAHRLSGRKVQIIGYSQGGMVPRWALRFWPDTRPLVDDDIGLDASNHGTLDARPACTFGCAPSFWQQATGSHFLSALNSYQETFPGISYTEIFSRTDEVVTPNLDSSGSSSVHGGGGTITNVAVQDICPNDVSEHLAMGSYDPVGYALALDAVTHAGAANPSRVNRTVCAQPFQPGVNPATFATDYAHYVAFIAQVVATYPRVNHEPALACYVFATCTQPSSRQAPPARRARPRKHRKRHRHRRLRRHARHAADPRFTG